MDFLVLGPVEIAVDDRRVGIDSNHQRVILAVLLAARGQVVSADRLIDAVWGARPPASARQSLHSHVSRLRRALATAGDVVATEPDGYRIDLTGHTLDADRFEALLADARHQPATTPEEVVRVLDEALGLWRGAAFGALADHEHVRAEAVRLERLRAAAVADRSDARLAAGEHHAVIGELEAAVAADPLAERPHGQLMLALYRSGRQADALAVYRQLQRRLADEVGIDPSTEVAQLHERILRHDDDVAAPQHRGLRSGGSAEAAPRPAVTAPARLVGRDEEVAAVTGLVTTTPLVTLTGPGGVGKSRLAEAVAAAAGERFDDGAVWCALAAVQDPGSVTATLADALGSLRAGNRSPEDALLAGLGTRRLLLVVDNCEHLLAVVAPLVERIRGRCANVAVLATSREHLRLSGEQVWEVTTLPVPRADADAAEVAASPAGALFCLRAQEVLPTFALREANAAPVAALCRRLDGLPLAIELAAARVRALAPAALAARIDQRFELLTGGSPAEAGRHRTLHALVDWSYGLLTDAERRLFDRLGVFAGPFTLAAAEQVGAGEPLTTAEVAGLLAELVDKSLVAVERAGAEVRYRLLDTLRAYALRRLEESGEHERAHRRHADYHVRLGEELAAAVRGPDERGALAQLDAAFDDLRMAHTWLVAAGAVDEALRLPAALHDDLVFRPRTEVFAWAERALALPGAAEQPASAAALATAARGAMNRGELDDARRLADAALAAAGAGEIAALWALYVLTTTALYEGRLDDALALADERLARSEELGEHYHRALAGVSRVLAQLYRGDVDEAVRAAGDARTAAAHAGNHTARAWACYASGEALLETDAEAAASWLEHAIDAAERVDRPFIAGVALVSLASLSARRGQTDRAVPLFRRTIAHWRPIGAYDQQRTTLRNLIDLLVRVGADEPGALLYGAVTAGDRPSFGAEADRLAAAWDQLEQRLGPDAARAAAEQGRRLSPAETVDAALAALDALRAGP